MRQYIDYIGFVEYLGRKTDLSIEFKKRGLIGKRDNLKMYLGFDYVQEPSIGGLVTEQLRIDEVRRFLNVFFMDAEKRLEELIKD